jgi:hypothetical protein
VDDPREDGRLADGRPVADQRVDGLPVVDRAADDPQEAAPAQVAP